MILTVLPGPWFSEHQFATIAKLTSIFLVIPFHLKQQAWVRVCVITVVPITSCFVFPLTWCRCWLITTTWNLSTTVSWSSSTLWALPGIQLNSWWVIPSLPLDDSCSHRPLYCIPSNTKLLLVLCCTLSFMLSNLCYDLPRSITIFDVKNVVRIAPPLKKFLL